MSDIDATVPPPHAPEGATAAPAPVGAPVSAPQAPPTARSSSVLPWLALAMAVAALAGAGLIWQRLGQTEQTLARRSTDTLTQASTARTLAAQAEEQTKALQARLGVAELRLSEVTLQRSQLEELMLSVSRSRDDSLVQDLESALRLAVQQSQLTGSSQPLISALQGAEQRIERAAQPRLNPVQRAIARDVERIRAASQVDVPALASRLDELVRVMDELPLRNAVGVAHPAMAPATVPPGAPKSAAAVPPGVNQAKGKAAANPAASEPTNATPAAPAGADSLGALWERFNTWRTEAPARWWAQLRQGTADLVRVSRIDQPDAALLAPEQSQFLRENLKLMLLNARLGLLARQFDTARHDVQSVQRLLERYFDDAQPATRLAAQTLTQLAKDLRHETLPRPDDTLAALAVAAGGR